MSDDKPVVTVTQSEHVYKTTKENGLLFHESIQYPDTPEGWRAWAEQLTKPIFTHAAALEQIEGIIKLANAVTDEYRDISENNENPFSPFRYAETLKCKANGVLIDIKTFEASEPDDSVRAIYYQTVVKALSLCDDAGLLYTALLERDAVRGRKQSKTKTHHKVPLEKQKQAVAKYRKILNEMAITKAGELIAKEYGVSRKTIRTWNDNYP